MNGSDLEPPVNTRSMVFLRTHDGDQQVLSRHLTTYKGNVTETQGDLDAWAKSPSRGIRPNCHANGDVALDRVLTAFERAQKCIPAAVSAPRLHIARLSTMIWCAA